MFRNENGILSYLQHFREEKKKSEEEFNLIYFGIIPKI